jgi:hypothetical protein
MVCSLCGAKTNDRFCCHGEMTREERPKREVPFQRRYVKGKKEPSIATSDNCSFIFESH